MRAGRGLNAREIGGEGAERREGQGALTGSLDPAGLEIKRVVIKA